MGMREEDTNLSKVEINGEPIDLVEHFENVLAENFYSQDEAQAISNVLEVLIIQLKEHQFRCIDTQEEKNLPKVELTKING